MQHKDESQAGELQEKLVAVNFSLSPLLPLSVTAKVV